MTSNCQALTIFLIKLMGTLNQVIKRIFDRGKYILFETHCLEAASANGFSSVDNEDTIFILPSYDAKFANYDAKFANHETEPI